MRLTREFLAQIGGWAVLKEAGALQQAGRIVDVACDDAFLSGQLKLTTGTLTSRLKLGERLSDVENLCPCRQAREHGVICPHVVALGLEWIARQQRPAPNATKPAIVKSTTPGLSIFGASEATTPDTEPLTISFLLPLQFAQAWRSGSLRIILEAAPPGKPAMPWEAALKNHAGPLIVRDEAVDALRLLQQRAKGPLPGIVELAAADYDSFFSALIEVPHVWLGKKSALAVGRAATKPKVQVTRQPDGRMRIELLPEASESGEWLPSRQGRWRFTGTALAFHPLPNPMLQRLIQQPLLLPPGEVPHFLQLPSLADQVEVLLCPATQKIEWRETKPRFFVQLDGTLTGLSCRLEARYGKSAALLSSPSFQAPRPEDPSRWLADPSEAGIYWGRDAEAEKRARADLALAGFSPTPRDPERHGLTGENAVIAFLANHLPAWRRQWQVELSPRLQSLLGQYAIIEPRVAIRGSGSGEEWLTLDTNFSSTDGSVSLSAGEVQQLLQTGRSHKRLASGKTALLLASSIEAWNQVLIDCDPEAGLGTAKINPHFAPYLEEALRDSGIVQTDGTAWKAPDRLRTVKPLQCPSNLEKVLRPYQKEGVAWIHTLASNGLAGILADEMGLGKTLQALAYLAAHKASEASGTTGPALVIAPTSLLVNWQREAERFAPELKTAVLHGAERHQIELKGIDLLITSYALIRRDIEKYRGLEFELVVLDEAQHIKNRFSQNAQAVKALRAKHRLILTGTPLENSLLDLWSMFDFLMPGYLGPATSFRDRYETPIAKQNDAAVMKRLRQRIHPFLLRRTKADVAQEIPAKLENVTYCDLTAEQREVYQSILEQGRREVFEHSGKQGNAGKRTMAMLTTLTRLRQTCCHLDLLPLQRPKPWDEPSAKLDSLFEMISEAVDGGHRLLVFSQFVKLLQLIALRLQKETIGYCYLDGSTVDRQAEIDRFQTSPEIPLFLISLKAGGTGLNLTSADTVIHCDPWWNPAVEDQATARAHRIGQQKVVTSYKLIARGTVEEKILQLQEKKKELIAQTLLGEEALLAHLTQKEWEELLS